MSYGMLYDAACFHCGRLHFTHPGWLKMQDRYGLDVSKWVCPDCGRVGLVEVDLIDLMEPPPADFDATEYQKRRNA